MRLFSIGTRSTSGPSGPSRTHRRPRLAATLLAAGVLGGTGAAIPLVQSSAVSKIPFTLTTSSGTVTVAPGTTGVLTLTAVRAKGFTSPIYLGSRSVPRGVKISTAANPLKGTTTTVKITVDASVSPKTLSATLTGSSKGKTSSRTIKIVVAKKDAPLPVDPTTPVTTAPTAVTLPPTPAPTTVAPTVAPTTVPAVTTTAAPFNDFSIVAEPAAVTLPSFGTVTSTIKITRTGTFADFLDFSVENLPANVSYSFTAATATSPSVTLTLIGTGAPTGVSEITVKSRARTTKIALTVGAATPLTATPTSAAVNPGATVNVALRWGRIVAGSVVSWTATNLPFGVTATFIPNNTTSVETTMTLTAASNAVVGLANITVTAASGTNTDSVLVPVTVGNTGVSTGSGTVNPTTAAVNPGASTTLLFTPAGINVNQQLVLSQTGLPANVSVSAAVSGTGLNLTLQTNGATVLGLYNITFTATQGSVTSSATFALNVLAVGATTTTTPSTTAQGFTFGVTPTALTVARGASGSVGLSPVFTGAISPVNFTVTGQPTGSSLSFSGTNPNAGSMNLIVAAGATTPVGTYTLVIKGEIAGRGAQSTNVTLTIS
jgi:hypothetical protein